MTEPLPVSFLVTLNQSAWFHNHDICPDPNDWILFEAVTQYVGKLHTHILSHFTLLFFYFLTGGALSLSKCSIWDQKGHLLSTMVQQALIRTKSISHNTSIASFEKLKVESS